MEQFATHIAEIRADLAAYRAAGLKIFATSSFQPQSVVLLHLIEQADPTVPIFFLNTGYHFPETLQFRRDLAKRFNLEFIDLFSAVPRNQQRDAAGNLLFTSDPDYCCHINKVQPLDPILLQYDVWINGIRRGQNANRARMNKEEKSKFDVLRYHPILEWTQAMIFSYMNAYDLPQHPLVQQGYFSVGCEPCTRRLQPGENNLDSRSGRWAGMKKNECGLHTDLVVAEESSQKGG